MDLKGELSEAATPSDHLGFHPSVEAAATTVAGLLEGDNPVVVSVVGGLGTGKSSFILQLLQALHFGHTVLVTFNAQIAAGPSMWSALVDRIGAALYQDLHQRFRSAGKGDRIRVGTAIVKGRPSAPAHWRDVAWWLVQGDGGLPSESQEHFYSLFTDAAADLPGRGLGRGEGRSILTTLTVAGALQSAALLGKQLPAATVSETIESARKLVNAQMARRPAIPTDSEEFLSSLNALIQALLPPDARLVIVVEDVARLDAAGRQRFEHTLGFIQGIRRAFVCIADDTARVTEHPSARLHPGTAEAFSARAIGLRIEVPVVRANVASRFLFELLQPHIPAAFARLVAQGVVRLLSAHHVLTPRLVKRGLRYCVSLLRLTEPAALAKWPQPGPGDAFAEADARVVEAGVHLVMLLMLDDALDAPLDAEDWIDLANRHPEMMDRLPWCIWDGSDWVASDLPPPLRVARRGVRWWLLLRSVRPGDTDWLDAQEAGIASALVDGSRAWMAAIAAGVEDLPALEDRLRRFLRDDAGRRGMRRVLEFVDRVGGSIPYQTGLSVDASPRAIFDNLVLVRDLPDVPATSRLVDILRSADLAPSGRAI